MSKQPCSYCGLPTSVPTPDIPTESLAYCCLGCRIASGIVKEDGQSEWTVTRLGIAIFFSMNVMVFTLVLWTWNVHNIESDARIVAFRGVLRYACLLFSTPVLILLGGPLIESSIDALRQRQLKTDVLLLLGVAASFAYSIAALFFDSPDVYFEVCCMILVAVTLGKWLEGTAKQKATNAIRSLRELLPKTVRIQRDGSEIEKPIDEVIAGDVVRVLPGERIPLDGSVAGGACVVDEQLITGESLPVTKGNDETVFAGSLNLSHELTLDVTSPTNDGTIARLMKAVELATGASCQSIRLADRLATWFVPLIMVAAMTTLVLHWGEGLQNALMACVSVVLIACPCALGIATPMALWVAINSAARRGVLFRNGDAVIDLAKLRSLGLDKTGTVTTGDVRVVSERFAEDGSKDRIRSVALALARSSTHPLSKAMVAHLTDVQPSGELIEIQDHPGRGVTATLLSQGKSERSKSDCDRTIAMLGSRALAEELGLKVVEGSDATSSEGQEQDALVCVGWDGEIKAHYLMRDTLRADSVVSMEQLKKLNLSLTILTGDTASRAATMEAATGVRAIGSLLPEEKAQQLSIMQHPVGMVGDGLNDAIALSTADVGIAMDCGADVSRESADVCLLGSSIAQLPWAIRLSRDTQKTVRKNLAWAVGYNLVGIGFAMSGNLNPIIAAIAMVGSSLFVLTNSLALGVKYGKIDANAALTTRYSGSDLDNDSVSGTPDPSATESATQPRPTLDESQTELVG